MTVKQEMLGSRDSSWYVITTQSKNYLFVQESRLSNFIRAGKPDFINGYVSVEQCGQ